MKSWRCHLQRLQRYRLSSEFHPWLTMAWSQYRLMTCLQQQLKQFDLDILCERRLCLLQSGWPVDVAWTWWWWGPSRTHCRLRRQQSRLIPTQRTERPRRLWQVTQIKFIYAPHVSETDSGVFTINTINVKIKFRKLQSCILRQLRVVTEADRLLIR